MRSRSNRRPVIRSLISCAAVATSMLVFSPPANSAEIVTCNGHSQPGATITVGGTPVRIPAIDVEICRDVSTSPLVPFPRVYTSGYPCASNCLAIVLDYGVSSADQEITITYSIDGSGGSRTIRIPASGGSDLCLLGVGFPAPPRSGCFISVDPDF